MQFKMVHNNLNISNLERSLQFYADALSLKETRRITAPDGSFIIVYLSDSVGNHLLELTWLKDHPEAYDLGENEFHLAFETADYDEALAYHKSKGWVCFENQEMGIYFIEDPDGYWLEVIPAGKY